MLECLLSAREAGKPDLEEGHPLMSLSAQSRSSARGQGSDRDMRALVLDGEDRAVRGEAEDRQRRTVPAGRAHRLDLDPLHQTSRARQGFLYARYRGAGWGWLSQLGTW